MGKGGTKFVGEAISHRTSRPKGNYTSKELRKMMEKYVESGVHPEVERLERLRTIDVQVYPLPDTDPHRPYVFIDVNIGSKPAGRLVIELFEDEIPAAAAHLRNRCLPGSTTSLVGTSFHKLLSGYGLFGGRNSRSVVDAKLPVNNKLRHVDKGAVSVSLDGAEIAVALGRSLHMDATHQVCGRIAQGMEVLDQIADLSTLPDDCPRESVKIVKAGPTTSKGTHEDLDATGGKKLTAVEAAEKLAQESTLARSAVMMAVQEGLGQKRKAEEAGPSSSKGGASTARAAGTSKEGSKKSKMLDSMLGDLSDSSSSGSDAD